AEGCRHRGRVAEEVIDGLDEIESERISRRGKIHVEVFFVRDTDLVAWNSAAEVIVGNTVTGQCAEVERIGGRAGERDVPERVPGADVSEIRDRASLACRAGGCKEGGPIEE